MSDFSLRSAFVFGLSLTAMIFLWLREAGAQTLSRAVLDLSQAIPVAGGGTFTSSGNLDEVVVNDCGNWIARVRGPGNPVQFALVKDGFVILKTGDSLPSGKVVSVIHLIAFNNAGDIAADITQGTTVTTGLAEALWVNGSVWIEAGSTPGPTQLSGSTYTSGVGPAFLKPVLNEAGEVTLKTRFSPGSIDAVVTVAQPNPTLQQVVRALPMDPVAGTTPPPNNGLLLDTSTDIKLSCEDNGTGVLNGAVTVGTLLVIQWTAGQTHQRILGQDDLSPEPGLKWLEWDCVDFNASQRLVVAGRIYNGPPTTIADFYIGTRDPGTGTFSKVVRQGDTISMQNVTPSTFAELCDTNEVLWRGVAGSSSAMYIDQSRLLGTGDTTTDGLGVSSIPFVPTAPGTLFSFSRNGRFALFPSLVGGVRTVLLVDRLGAGPTACLGVQADFCFGDGSGTACPCGNNSAVGAMAGCLNSTGQPGILRGQGVASIGTDSLVLTALLIGNTAVQYFQGTAPAGSGVPFGDGLLCNAGVITRLKVAFANAAGHSVYPQLGEPRISVSGGVTPASPRYYQGWYRDASLTFCSLPDAFNFTNGVTITWTP